MKKRQPIAALLFLLPALTATMFAANAPAETAEDYNAKPPFVTRGADPNVLLNLSIETPMYGAAYNDQQSDDNDDGAIDIEDGECNGRDGSVGRCYFTSNEYLGIFDPNKEYSYNSTAGYFEPVGTLNSDHSTKSGGWSGNFLNWATMTAIDEFRWALTGGRRTTDSTSSTVIQRANLPSGYSTDWYPPKRITSDSAVDANAPMITPSSVTPYTNKTIYIYNHNYQVNIGTTLWGYDKAQNLEVKAKVCDPDVGIESNCVAYKTSGGDVYYKPEGLIQKNADRMRFAVMSYAFDSSADRDGGVLRANMKYVGPTLPDGTDNPVKEWGSNGIYINDPDDSVLTGANQLLSNSGVINYINKFGQNGYKSHDPVSELFYECLNYFKHRGRTPEYADGLSATAYDGFPVITAWDDPIESWCQPNFIIGINDANPWEDKSLPGTYFTAATFNGVTLSGADYGEPGNADPDYSVTKLTNIVGDLQGLTGTYQLVGCTATNCDQDNTSKYITGLGEVMGTYSYPIKQNSYYVAGLAYYAHTYDLRDDLEGKQTITTYMIDTQEYSATPLTGEMNMLWLTGKYGGFDEIDNPDDDNENPNNTGQQLQPNLDEEWDADNDGDPDNYILATKPEKMISGLSSVFLDISKRASSGTAASVISGSKSGEGAIYQSVFYPTYRDDSMNQITWAGSVHASLVDSEGRIREDTNGNGILDIDDYVIVFKRDSSTNLLTIEKYSVVAAVAEVTNIILPLASDSFSGAYFLLNSVSNRYYVWYTVDGEGDDPQPASDMTAILVALSGSETAAQVATKTANAIAAYVNTFDVTITGATATITAVTAGEIDDATSGTMPAGFSIIVATQGTGETEVLDFTGDAEDIKYLWNANDWLNGISDTDITKQRQYNSTEHKRYIFTFIDADEDGVADDGEQQDFVATSLPGVIDLVDTSSIFPYIPVSSNSESLPTYVTSSGTVAEITEVTFPSGLAEMAGDYFFLNSITEEFYVWFSVNGAGTDPELDPKIGVQVDILASDSALEIAVKTRAALIDAATNPDAAAAFTVTNPTTATLTITSSFKGATVDASAETLGDDGLLVSIAQQGTTGVANHYEYLRYQTQRVINYIRGQDQDKQDISYATIPAFRSRSLDLDNDGTLETTWRLGDIVYSSPTTVTDPQEALHLLYKDSSYGTFAAQYANRRTVVYAGANDGMLHAFNGGFYEDRFDIYPAGGDGEEDAGYLLQPKNSDGTSDTTIKAYELGQELWAYIPYNLLPHLYWLTEVNYDHVYYVDLKPRIFDAKIFDNDSDHPGGWGTVLVGGMRFGGGRITVDTDRIDGDVDTADRTMSSAYYILDITNPEVPPTVLGELTFPHLGYTTCYPSAATVKDKDATSTLNKWYLIFGSGPAESDGSPGTNTGVSLPKAISEQTAKLYVVDLLALVQDKKFNALDTSGTMVNITSGTNGYFQDFTTDENAFVSDPTTVDFDLDYKADAVYFGTVSYNIAPDTGTSPWGGKLRRLVMDKQIKNETIDPEDPTEWNGDSVLIDLEISYQQPITAAPTIGIDSSGNDWVFFGTGRYLVRTDGTNDDQQAFYGIKEPQAETSNNSGIYTNSYAEVGRALLYDATNVKISSADGSVSGSGFGVGDDILWSTFVSETEDYSGWYREFPDPRERNISQAALYGALLTFTTYVPSEDLCDFEGEGWLYGLYYLTGTATPTSVFSSPGDDPDIVPPRISTGLGPPSKPGIHVDSPTSDSDTTAVIQTSDGSLITVEQDNYGQTRSGRTAWSYK